jgi:2,3-bisphosphoglycerate-dependent phosphoglycerate mutase
MVNIKGKLILIRHQESRWNKLGFWTGLRDIILTEEGCKKAEEVGVFLKKYMSDNNISSIDNAFASMEVRSIETLALILETCGLYEVPTKHAQELNERDYGDYTGKDKWQMEKELGEEEFQNVRRGWAKIPPNGESLEMVYNRSVPYFQKEILPLLNQGKNVLIVAHGNSLRSLLKYIENISDEEIANIEFAFNEFVVFNLDDEGKSIKKDLQMMYLA